MRFQFLQNATQSSTIHVNLRENDRQKRKNSHTFSIKSFDWRRRDEGGQVEWIRKTKWNEAKRRSPTAATITTSSSSSNTKVLLLNKNQSGNCITSVPFSQCAFIFCFGHEQPTTVYQSVSRTHIRPQNQSIDEL